MTPKYFQHLLEDMLSTQQRTELYLGAMVQFELLRLGVITNEEFAETILVMRKGIQVSMERQAARYREEGEAKWGKNLAA